MCDDNKETRVYAGTAIDVGSVMRDVPRESMRCPKCDFDRAGAYCQTCGTQNQRKVRHTTTRVTPNMLLAEAGIKYPFRVINSNYVVHDNMACLVSGDFSEMPGPADPALYKPVIDALEKAGVPYKVKYGILIEEIY